MNARPAPPVETAQPTPTPDHPDTDPDTGSLDTLPTGTPDDGPGSLGGPLLAPLLRLLPPVAAPLPDPFCVCGHRLDAHHPGGRCAARLPDPCTCHGAREAARSREARTLTVAALAGRVERDAA